MPPQRAPSVDEIVATFRATDVGARKTLIARCPPGRFNELAVTASGLSTPGFNLQALQYLMRSYEFDGPYEYGAAFGEACYRLGREMYDGANPNIVFLQAAANAAVGWLTSLSHSGRHADARDRGREALEWINAKGAELTLVIPIQLRLVEAAFALQHFDDADSILRAIAEAASWDDALGQNYRSCWYWLRQHKQSGTRIPGDRTNIPDEWLQWILRGGEPPDGRSPQAAPDKTAQTDSVAKIAWKVAEQFGRERQATERTVMRRIITAGQLFQDPVAGRDHTRIAEVEPVLREARDWMRAHKSRDGENEACWGLYLCYSRMNRDGEAVDALQTIRANIERARANIADPVERAGQTARYPQLYPCLVTLLYKLRRNTELLEAIEASKGRALADVMTLAGRSVVSDMTFASAVRELPQTLASGAHETAPHYVSYFVDDDSTYAALVSAGGDRAIGVAKLPLSRLDLQQLAREIRDAADAGAAAATLMPPDMGERLAALTTVLGDVLEDGDHVCYAPDDILHLLPLQAAHWRGDVLVQHASVSRVHGAHVLQQQLAKTSRMSQRFTVFEVPSTGDTAYPARLDVLARPGKSLAASLPGTRVFGAAVDVGQLQALDLRDTITHFATHGIFPRAEATGEEANPYYSSGLLVGAAGHLPSLDSPDHGQAGPHLLSPARLVNANVDFSGGHVTLQACVSGLAREGIGGDALGLEWAFFQLGASSILSTHWNVSAQTSAAFAVRFYKKLLDQRQSRAAAWRQTVLEFRNRHDALAKPYHWSAFSLSGDWR